MCQHGHRVCFQCLEAWAWEAVNTGSGQLKCIAAVGTCEKCGGEGGCTVDYLVSELERALPAALMEQLTKLDCAKALRDAKVRSLVKCAHCGVSVIFTNRPKKQKLFVCPECSGRTCLKCKKREHPGFSCREASHVTANMVASKITAEVVRTCPGCGLEFLKEQGCNKMECPTCHAVMCYVCKKRIYDANPYAHFSKSGKEQGKCPLYVTNWAFNRNQVKMATKQFNEMATQLIEENERNKPK